MQEKHTVGIYTEFIFSKNGFCFVIQTLTWNYHFNNNTRFYQKPVSSKTTEIQSKDRQLLKPRNFEMFSNRDVIVTFHYHFLVEKKKSYLSSHSLDVVKKYLFTFLLLFFFFKYLTFSCLLFISLVSISVISDKLP